MGNSLRSKRDITIAVFGLDGAGKSTFIDNLTEDDFDDNPLPTVGYNTRRITKGRYNIVLAEVGGGVHIRGVWPKYFAQSHALIYMIDGCSSTERIQETKTELHKVLSDDRMTCKPLLVLCNKDDQPTCIEAQELVNQLDLSNVLKESVAVDNSGLVTQLTARVWLCSCLRPSGRQDPRLHKSLNWLLQKISDEWSRLSERVQEQHQIELDEKERERQARIAKRRQRIEEEERLEREAIALVEQEGDITIDTNGKETVTAEIEPPINPPPPLLSSLVTSSDTKLETVSLMSINPIHPKLTPITSLTNGNPLPSTSASLQPSNSLFSTSTTSSSNSCMTATTKRQESQESITSGTKIVKTARIIRKLKSRNKLHPANSDEITQLTTNSSSSNSTATSNSTNMSSSFSSKPPLLSPWISNTTQLPVEKAPSFGSTVVVQDDRGKRKGERHVAISEDVSVISIEDDGSLIMDRTCKNKKLLAPITNHSMGNMVHNTFTLPQDVILAPPLSWEKRK